MQCKCKNTTQCNTNAIQIQQKKLLTSRQVRCKLISLLLKASFELHNTENAAQKDIAKNTETYKEKTEIQYGKYKTEIQYWGVNPNDF